MPVAAAKKRAECPILDNGETPYKLSELAKLLPGRPSYDAVLEWVTIGRDHPDRKGEKIVMEKINTHAGYASSVEAYWRWQRKFNEA